MELLIDDCMILDYGKILLHKPAGELMAEHPNQTLEDIFIELTGKY
jgi:hypothetical protein